MTTTEAAPEIVDDVVEVGDPVDGEAPITFPVLALESVDTSDGRYLMADSLKVRPLPLSLLAVPESSHGGDEPRSSVVVGRLDSIIRTPGPDVISKVTGEPFPEGSYVWSATGAIDTDVEIDGRNVYRMVRLKYLRGISVDLAGMDYEIVGEEGFSPVDPENPRRQIITHSAEIAAATLVPIAAFAEAYAELPGDDAVMVQPAEGLVASASPSWRSVEVGDDVHLPGLVAAGDEPHTGGMIALVPANTDDLVVAGGEPAEELHLTLAYLGDDVTGWSEEQTADVLAGAQQIADTLGRPTTAEIMGHAAFNPTGVNDREPCAVYLVSGEELPTLKGEVSAFDTSEHPVFLPHITAGYGLTPADLTYVGPVTFDRIRVALGPDVHDFPLGETEPAAAPETDGEEPAMAALAPGEEGSTGPGEAEYGKPHVYARDPQSGAGNCVCGAPADDDIHIESPLAPAMADADAAPVEDALPDGEDKADQGWPDEQQDCEYGEHPAVQSLLFADGERYVATCLEHDADARAQIEAEGFEVDQVVEIKAAPEAEEAV